MKVAIDISPLKTAHSARGVGAYTQNLIDEFSQGDWPLEFEFFETPKSPPKADIVHYPYFDLFFHTLPIVRSQKRVVTIHDVIPLVFPTYFPKGSRGYISLFFQKLALKNVDAIICDSKTSKKDIISRLSSPPKKIHVVYLAPSKAFRPINERTFLEVVSKTYNLPKDFRLYVGDVNWNKNIHGLLEGVKKARINLVMVGKALTKSDLPETLHMETQIAKLKLQKHITRTGFVPQKDLVAIYNLARATILPSFYEGFGLPVLESMACGTPVICSKVASLVEIGAHVAIFCDPTDPKDISEKISYILHLQEKQKKHLSQKSQNHASKYSWHNVAKQTIQVYQSVLRVQ